MRGILLLLLMSLCIGHLALGRPAPLDGHIMRSNTAILGKRDQTLLYLVVPEDGTDETLLRRLEKSIQSVTGLSDINSWRTDDELMWFSVELTEAEVKKLEDNADVAYVQADEAMESTEAPSEDWNATALDISPRSLFERDQQYIDQSDAVDELRVISTPPGGDWTCYADYRYPKEAGQGIYIYHIEDGVQSEYAKEFEGRMEDALVTPFHHGFPQSPSKHSTCVAEKALGTTYGVAKEARYVPVLYGMPSAATITQGFKAALDDLRRDKEEAEKSNTTPKRYGNSLIIISSANRTPFDQLPLDRRPYTLMRQYMSQLINLGAPIVSAAGNRADETTGEVEVNTIPSWFASGNILPVINVGNADAQGQIASNSRRGEKVSVFADGMYISCSGQKQNGTSFSGPQVGGGIAIGMSQKEGPFYEATKGKTGKGFVMAVREFVMTQGSWQRPGGANMFWNMAEWT